MRRPHGIELMQHLQSAELDRCVTLRVMGELQGFILSVVLIDDKYESLYVVYPPKGHT